MPCRTNNTRKATTLVRLIAVFVTLFSTSSLFAQKDATKIVAISASQSQKGNPVQHALDDNSSTRWSAEGKGNWLQIELSKPADIQEFGLGFYRADRKYNIEIAQSNDGKSWTTLLQTVSAGDNAKLQNFAIKGKVSRYWRIVANGSSENNWNNIHTLKIPGIVVAKELQKTIPKSTGPAPATGSTTGKLVLTEFAKSGMVGSVVGISVDNQGRVYVTHTNRRNNAAIDIRRNRSWLNESLASRSVEDKRKMIRSRKSDWESLSKFKEKIVRVADTTGDGKADERIVFYEGFNSEVHGLAGGVLFHDKAAYVTCIPGFYKLPDSNDDGRADGVQELAHGFGTQVGYGGHDMHGPTLGPDGRIYWSIGDKGIHVISKEGVDYEFPCQGGVMRVETDGSGFEVFAHGLRNPQELAFDEFGNLFTVDNDADGGDKERFHFVVEGTDSGWRANYQYRSNGKKNLAGYNPWLVEKLFAAKLDSQPAYLTPPLANYSTGPIGFTYNPGTALNEAYRKHFFLAESNKRTTAFQVEPAGAGFTMTNPHTVLSGPFATGISFGPDGALYLADWGQNAWAPHENGRVITLDDPSAVDSPLRNSTAAILKAGVANNGVDQLVKLLAHADQRVRLLAQFELASREPAGKQAMQEVALTQHDESSELSLLARIHAIWGIGQQARRKKGEADQLISLLNDPVMEIRAQTAKILGDARCEMAAEPLAKLLEDPSLRVRLHAGIALSKVNAAPYLSQITKMLEQNGGDDRFVRHAGVMALAQIAAKNPEPIVNLQTQISAEVRLAAVVALRIAKAPQIAVFLTDVDPRVASEAARAIHDDLSIEEALPALAQTLPGSTGADETLIKRALSANLRVGDAPSALRIARFAASDDAKESLRVEALQTLAVWLSPPPLDQVQGTYRGLPPRRVADAHAALDRTLGALFAMESKELQSELSKVIKSLKYSNALERVTQLAFDTKQPASVRSSALSAMSVLDSPELKRAIDLAISSSEAELRIAALKALCEVEPSGKETVAALNNAIESEALLERQTAVRALGTTGSDESRQLLRTLFAQLVTGKAPADLQLDIYQAAKSDKSFAKGVSELNTQIGTTPLQQFGFAFAGGDAKQGEEIFRTSSQAQCSRCHRIGGTQRTVGPDLAKLATRKPADYILRSLVEPNADIDKLYRVQQFVLDSGKIVSGTIVSESKTKYQVATETGKVVVVSKDDVDERLEQNNSIMPDVKKVLSLEEVRDLVAFLKTLK